MTTTIEDSMLEHYNYIINIKDKELNELYKIVRYREQELEQLVKTFDEMSTILNGPAVSNSNE